MMKIDDGSIQGGVTSDSAHCSLLVDDDGETLVSYYHSSSVSAEENVSDSMGIICETASLPSRYRRVL